MVKIIDTNMNQEDFQSRVIKYSTWEDFVNVFKNYKYNRKSIAPDYFNNNQGIIIHFNSTITNLKYDNFHLSCNIEHNGFVDKKMAYLIK